MPKGCKPVKRVLLVSLKEKDNPEYDQLIQRNIELEKGSSLVKEERNRFRTENGDLKGVIYEMRVVYEGGPVYDWVEQDKSK